MRLERQAFAFGLALLSGAAASPAPYCSAVTALVSKSHQQSAATAFCSSYLSIPASTKTVTVTAKTG